MKSISTDRHSFFIDLHEGTDVELTFKQFDNNTRHLVTVFTAHDSRFNLTGARVDLWVYKPDDKLAISQAEILDPEIGMVEVSLTRQMLACSGKAICEYVITYEDERVVSFPPFIIDVKESYYNENRVVSTDEFNLFFNSLARMENWVLRFDEKMGIINRAFDERYREIDERSSIVLNENKTRFDNLYASVVAQITLGFRNQYLKNAEDFKEIEARINNDFATKMREVEKRFNQLDQKVDGQAEKILGLTADSETNLNTIIANKEESNAQLNTIKEINATSEQNLNEVIAYHEEVDAIMDDFKNDKQAFDEYYNTVQNAENERIRQENTRKSDEVARKSNEVAREQAEAVRISNEEARVEAENTRQETFIAAETNRNTNEVQRIASETERVNAENIRQEAEQERIDTFNQMKLSWLKYRIISETE